MKILFLDPCAQLGGAERCLIDAMASLRRAQPDWQLHLIAGERGPLLEEASQLGVTAETLAYPARVARLGSFARKRSRVLTDCAMVLPELLWYAAALRRRIQAIAPGLVHSNGAKMHLLASAVSPAPVVWHIHDYLEPRPAVAAALRKMAPRCRAAIAISKSAAEDAACALRGRVPVTEIHNAVDLARFHPRGARLDLDRLASLPDAPPGTARVGLVATFAKWKGHDIFLQALAKPEMKAVRGYVIGGPIYRTEQSQHTLSELRELARALGLENRIGFTGFVADPASAMRSLDVVVHASTEREPFGLTIAEAMACGRAVIASNAGGAAELYSDFEDGVASPPGDPETLARLILYLARDPIARGRLGARARATAEARFNRDRLGIDLAAFYEKTLDTCAYSTSIAATSTAA